MKIFETQCEYCKNIFYLQKGQFHAGRFCCVDCFRQWRKENCRVELICEVCGKLYTRRKSVSDGSRFCSMECMCKGRNGSITFNCDYCDKEVVQHKSLYHNTQHHYCSMECSHKGRIGKYVSKGNIRIKKTTYVSFICDNCGEEAIQKYDNYNPKGKNHFCNKQCEGAWRSENIIGEKCGQWKGGITDLRYTIRNSRNYRLWRKECFEREDYTCEICNNRGGYLEVHHVKPFALICDEHNIQSLEESKMCNELWDTENGQVLCKACHNSITFNKFNEETK
jgi:predicted RNA-binding Zn-ribbon protein involved in translation (DUF1610 family)